MSTLEGIVGLVMLVGLVGVVVPVFPGLIVVIGAGFVWALQRGGPGAWAVFAIIAAVGIAGIAASSVLPARRASSAGAPGWVIASGAVGLVVGFFVVPVIGALIGFPVGVFVAELVRHRHPGPASRATWVALKGVGIGIAIQLGAGVWMIGVWLAAVLAT
jgi:uncharacterized protein YqgC (DUF456 family)